MKNVMKLIQCISALIIALIIGTSASLAETVEGLVYDETGETLIGASVSLKGNKGIATVTDIDGYYKLPLPASVNPKNAVLVVSYVGYEPMEVKVNGRSKVDITLASSNNILDDVVVVGYGQQKKVSVVGAITQTSGEVLERAGGVSSVGAALTGNLPGVITESSTGMPGAEDPRIVIRGVSSWNSSDPLVLVDGIERPMSAVDISSIESISVLKDASATAVYGVKGANGVILITTKRGFEGRAKISVGFNATAKVVSKLPQSLESAEAIEMANRAIERELGVAPDSWAAIYPNAVIEKFRNPATLEEQERYPNVNWQDELFKKWAMAYNPNINLSGGTKNVKYFAAIDFLHEGDLFKTWDNHRGYNTGWSFNRVNVRSNLDFKITPTTDFKVNMFGSHGQRVKPWGAGDGDWGTTQLWQAAYSSAPDGFLPQYSDGSWGFYAPNSQGSPNSVKQLADAGMEKVTTTRINTDFTLSQDLSFITPGLRASAMVAWDNVFVESGRGINDLYHDAQEKYIDPLTGEVTVAQKGDSKTGFDFVEGVLWNISGGSLNNWATQRNLYYQAQLFWARKFAEAHDVSLMGVFNRTENTYGNDFTNYREDWAFRVTYNFKDKYFLEYNGAYNGSERFDKKNRFAFFNSGAVGWMITQEKFMNWSKGFLDLLKVRYSYGEVGDDYVPQRWLYATQWATGDKAYLDLSSGTESPYAPYYQTQIGNPNVHWEKSIKQNLGIDYSFWHHFAAGSLEFFTDTRNDVLLVGNNRAVPTYYGGGAPTANLGKVRTRGFELELRLDKSFGKFHLWGNFNMTHAKNKILKYDEPQLTPDYQKSEGFAIGQDHITYGAGFANNWSQIYGMTQHDTKDDQKLPGQWVAVDYNGDGVIDSNDSAPYGYTGTPQNTYSATIGVNWKGWSAFVQFYGVSNVTRWVEFTSLSGHKHTVYDFGSFWSGSDQDADLPMPRWDSSPSYYSCGDYYHYDGSYIRLKNAEVAYTWTSGWIKRMGLSYLKLYINGNNLLQWSHMPDDRESNFAGTGLASQGAYPTVRRFNLGIKFDI